MSRLRLRIIQSAVQAAEQTLSRLRHKHGLLVAIVSHFPSQKNLFSLKKIVDKYSLGVIIVPINKIIKGDDEEDWVPAFPESRRLVRADNNYTQ